MYYNIVSVDCAGLYRYVGFKSRFIIFLLLLLAALPAQVGYAQPKKPQGVDLNSSDGTTTIKADPNQTIQGALKEQKEKRLTKTKDPNKAGWLGMRMQDLTARFNRYFNAKLRYTEGVLRLKQEHKDNYDDILPIYVFKNGDGTTISANLDETVKKASLAIQLKPNSKWVDDCYLLIGQSYYLKGDKESASSSFQYITKNFGKNIRKLPKKQLKQAVKKEQAKEKEDIKKQREETQKEKKELAAEKKKQAEKEKKEREKTREQKKKELEKSKKERQKELAEKKKQREKEKKQREKERAKAQKAKKKGKPVPQSKSKTTTTGKKTGGDEETKTEEFKPADTQPPLKEDTKAENDKTEEDKSKSADKNKKEAEKDKTEVQTIETAEEDTSALAGIGLTAEEEAKGSAGGGFMQHKPARYDAMIWLARTYIEKEWYAEAAQIIKIAKEDRRFPKKKLADLANLEAHYYLTRQDWPQAKVALQSAIKATKSKKQKARPYFILAQLNNRDGNFAAALNAFKKVLKSKPPFDMEFQAQLNIAQAKMRSGAYTPEQAIAALEKLTKENKYADVTDQIYFTMAEISIENGNMEQANAFLGESAKNSTTNKDQKGLSYLKLADLNYDLERYVQASVYYDSTLALLPKSFAKYNDIANRRSVLSELVEHLNTITLQDSLQRIAKMPDAARRAYLENVILQLEEAAAKKQAEEDAKQAAANAANPAGSNPETGNWYFYNQTARANGFNDFNQRWGTRPLVDNWRLNSKISGVIATAPADTSATSISALMDKAGKGMLSVDDLLKQLPLTPQALAASDTLIADALFAVGMAYRNRLNNLPKATETFDDLLRRYPDSQYSPQVHYTQYLIAKAAPDLQKATQHKNQLLQKYPETTYAKLVQDANYLQALNEKERQLEQYYEQTYAFYKQENFDQVKKRSQEVNTLFEANPLQPKFDLLNALITGHTQDKAAYIAALKDIVKKYPNDEVKTKAQEILQYIDTGSPATPAAGSTEGSSPYTFQAAAKQYLVVSFTAYSQQITALTSNLSNFNGSNFSVDKLKVNQMLLDPQTQVVLVKEFADVEKGMIYYRTLQQNESTVFAGIDTGYRYFLISKSNFTEYFKRKDSDAYYQFFTQNYK